MIGTNRRCMALPLKVVALAVGLGLANLLAWADIALGTRMTSRLPARRWPPWGRPGRAAGAANPDAVGPAGRAAGDASAGLGAFARRPAAGGLRQDQRAGDSPPRSGRDPAARATPGGENRQRAVVRLAAASGGGRQGPTELHGAHLLRRRTADLPEQRRWRRQGVWRQPARRSHGPGQPVSAAGRCPAPQGRDPRRPRPGGGWTPAVRRRKPVQHAAGVGARLGTPVAAVRGGRGPVRRRAGAGKGLCIELGRTAAGRRRSHRPRGTRNAGARRPGAPCRQRGERDDRRPGLQQAGGNPDAPARVGLGRFARREVRGVCQRGER